jgi:hypothetical protein
MLSGGFGRAQAGRQGEASSAVPGEGHSFSHVPRSLFPEPRQPGWLSLQVVALHRRGGAPFSHHEGLDGTTTDRAMLTIASVFAVLARTLIHDQVQAGLARARA